MTEETIRQYIENERKKTVIWVFAIAVFVIGIIFLFLSIFAKPSYYINPTCFYYVSDYEIKLYGINSSENHSVFVTDIPGAEPLIFDKITDPPTKIPLCIKRK